MRPLASPESSEPLRTLVIDDDEASTMSLVAYLKEIGFSAVGATSGESALALAEASPPACVFLDLRMPRMSGVEVAMRLRRMFDGAITIIAMTGADSDAMDYKLMLSVADFVMTKPLDLERLKAMLSAGPDSPGE
ncbi:MAG: response regulator [Burkholderiaceae bacterium]|nr:response regulator [Burkholderiaceae bacterium]